MRELLAQHQEFRNPIGCQIGRVHLAVPLKRGRRFQQTQPFDVSVLPALFVGNLCEVHVQKRGQRKSPFDIAAYLNELPAIAVIHCGIGNALKQMRAIAHLTQQFHRLGVPNVLNADAADVMIEAVQLLPHL